MSPNGSGGAVGAAAVAPGAGVARERICPPPRSAGCVDWAKATIPPTPRTAAMMVTSTNIRDKAVMCLRNPFRLLPACASAHGDVRLTGYQVRSTIVDQGDDGVRTGWEFFPKSIDHSLSPALDEQALREGYPVDDRAPLFDLDSPAQIDVRVPGVVEVDEVVLTVRIGLHVHVVDLAADAGRFRDHYVDL